MSLIIDKEIFEWLVSIEVIKSNQISQQVPSGRIALDQATTTQFMTGLLFSKLLARIASLYPKKFERPLANQSGLNALKNATTPSGKLHNWNIICEALKKICISVDHDSKTLILAGDFERVNGVLKEIFNVTQLKELVSLKTIIKSYIITEPTD